MFLFLLNLSKGTHLILLIDQSENPKYTLNTFETVSVVLGRFHFFLLYVPVLYAQKT